MKAVNTRAQQCNKNMRTGKRRNPKVNKTSALKELQVVVKDDVKEDKPPKVGATVVEDVHKQEADSQWKKIQKRRKKETITGAAKTQDLFRAADRKGWLYVERVKQDTTEQIIKEYLIEKISRRKLYSRRN